MALRFVWDERKAAVKRRKHGISFTEAATAFADPISVTIPDPDHTGNDERSILIGQTLQVRIVVVAHVEPTSFESLALDPRPVGNGPSMKKASKKSIARKSREGMRDEYDFSGGTRGKYAERFAAGTNLVLLAPDVAAEFRTAAAVNKALREVLKAKAKRQTA